MTNMQSSKSTNVSTKGFQFYNSVAGEDSSTLVLGYWNDMVSLKIHPMLPQNARQNNQMYNYSGGLSSVIGVKAVEQLIEAIGKIERQELMCAAVKGSTNTVVKIGDGSEYGDDFGWYLAIFETDTNGVGTNGWYYMFNNGAKDDIVMADYNEEDGTFNSLVVNTEVQIFKKYLESAIQIFTKANAHSVTQRMGYMIDKVGSMVEVVKGMCEQILFGRNSANSTTNNAPQVGQPQTAGNRGFSRRRRSADAVQTPASTPASSDVAPATRSRRGQTPPPVNTVSEDDLEAQLLNMSDDDDDLNLD